MTYISKQENIGYFHRMLVIFNSTGGTLANISVSPDCSRTTGYNVAFSFVLAAHLHLAIRLIYMKTEHC